MPTPEEPTQPLPAKLLAVILLFGSLGIFPGQTAAANLSGLIFTSESIDPKPGFETERTDTIVVQAVRSDTVQISETAQKAVAEQRAEGSKELLPDLAAGSDTLALASTTNRAHFLPEVEEFLLTDDTISRILEVVSENMEKQKLHYSSALGQDCSGIFHRLKDSLQLHLAAIMVMDSAVFQSPRYNTDRSSRQIADWYYRNDQLLIVEDPMVSRNSIRPGSVMFFGRSGRSFRNLNIDLLTDRKNNYSRNAAIQHIAVVTAVQTDDEGNVVGYTMMHARHPGGPCASRSQSKVVQSNYTRGLPPLGNWRQQWVAVANLVPQAERVLAKRHLEKLPAPIPTYGAGLLCFQPIVSDTTSDIVLHSLSQNK